MLFFCGVAAERLEVSVLLLTSALAVALALVPLQPEVSPVLRLALWEPPQFP